MPTLEDTLAGVILISLTFYALMGGADYGAGVWTLLAAGPRAREQRELIAAAIGPIWEANHVWLILVVTVLFTAFPVAFALIATTLHIPLTLLLIGIVLRGSTFAFRTNDVSPRTAEAEQAHRFWERVFAVSSVITPVCLGMTVGSIASGRLAVRQGSFFDLFVAPWLTPFAFAVGVLALALFALLAAVYLTVEATSSALREDFRRKALLAVAVVAIGAVLVLALSRTGAPEIREGLARTRWGWLFIGSAAGLWTLAVLSLWRRRFHESRVLAAGLTTVMLWGWAIAQYPYLVEPNLTIFNAAAPQETLWFLLIALVMGAVLLFPSLYYLYRIFKGRILEPG
jgi:cytochrome d ubiquinol oxidase subunit II